MLLMYYLIQIPAHDQICCSITYMNLSQFQVGTSSWMHHLTTFSRWYGDMELEKLMRTDPRVNVPKNPSLLRVGLLMTVKSFARFQCHSKITYTEHLGGKNYHIICHKLQT